MAEHGFDAYGMDVIPEAIDWAKDRMKQSSAKAEFCVGSVVDLAAYSDDFFDFVWDEGCLHCIIGPDRITCFANIFRVIKPGGFFYAEASLLNEELTERYEIDSKSYYDPEIQCIVRNEDPFYYLSKEEDFVNEVNNAGFDIKSIENGSETKETPYKLGETIILSVKPKIENG